MKRAIGITFTLISLLPITVYADDPATDIINILTEIESIESSINKDTGKISQNSLDQLNEAKGEWAKLSRAYGMADSISDKNARLWSANDWNDVLTQASGGNAARLQQLMQSYSTLYPTLQKGNSQSINPETLVSNTYNQTSSTYNAALSTSAYTYDDINNRINKLESLLGYVDNEAKNQNEKSAIDLNSRLVAEVGFTQLELLKLQSIKTQMEATKNQSELNSDTLDKQFMEYKP